MATNQRPLLGALVATSILCLSLGVFALRAEAGPAALGAASSPAPQFFYTLDQNPPNPLSVQGRRVMLENCEMALRPSPPLALRFASDRQKSVAVSYCRQLSQDAVLSAKTDAYAWLVLASSQIQDGEMELASQSIVWSALTGRAESWIARSRFDLVQDNYATLSPSARTVGDADATLLVPGRYGALVAQRYVLDDAFARRAESLIEEQPEAVQRRFVALIRRQLEERQR